ncbi:hypothetical protein [Serinicoccus marinus]|uniref:hypothetical protein n=1 Tax=Serinicoccus marinus TaxID=247333 RepID=UPI0030B90E4D
MILPITIGILTAGAIYLMLQRAWYGFIFGLSLLAPRRQPAHPVRRCHRLAGGAAARPRRRRGRR